MSKAWTSTHGENCVKHTSKGRSMLQLSKHGNPQSLVPIGVQMSAKMPKEHFIKHLVCTDLPYMKNNTWTYENMPQIHVKTQTTSTQMGLSLINKILKIWQEIKFSQPNTKINQL